MLFAEIRDQFGMVESACLEDHPCDIFRFYQEHGVDMQDVKMTKSGYTYQREGVRG